MRRIDILFVLVGLAVVGLGLLVVNQVFRLARNRDAEVVETALLNLMHRMAGSSWDKKRSVLLMPDYSSSKRTPYASSLARVTALCTDAKAKSELLGMMKTHGKSSSNVGPPAPLAQFPFDSCIAMATKSELNFDSHLDQNSSGVVRSMRLLCEVSAPSYSADGEVAVVMVWNVFGEDQLYVLKREKDSWRVVDFQHR